MKLFLFVGGLLGAQSSFANTAISIANGLYSTSSYICGLEVSVAADRIVAESTINEYWFHDGCDQMGSLNEYTLEKDGSFRAKDRVIPVIAEWVRECTPKKGNLKPCAPMDYDADGKLVFAIGDSLVVHAELTPLNENNFIAKNVRAVISSSGELNSQSHFADALFTLFKGE